MQNTRSETSTDRFSYHYPRVVVVVVAEIRALRNNWCHLRLFHVSQKRKKDKKKVPSAMIRGRHHLLDPALFYDTVAPERGGAELRWGKRKVRERV
jgi:hypothetical protein